MPRPAANIVLVGFASSGKTAVGRAAAPHLGLAFRDLDDEVELLHRAERGHARLCREIYSLHGRACFVGYERAALQRLAGVAGLLLATGGGTPIDPENRALLQALGTVVYIHAGPEAIFQRMQSKGAPLSLPDIRSLDDVRRHWRERDAIYRAIAQLTLRTDDLTIEQAVGELERLLAGDRPEKPQP